MQKSASIIINMETSFEKLVSQFNQKIINKNNKKVSNIIFFTVSLLFTNIMIMETSFETLVSQFNQKRIKQKKKKSK